MTETPSPFMPCPLIKDLCLVTAVDVEFNAATSLLTSRTFSDEFQIKTCQGSIGRKRVTVLQCGMGASAFANRLSDHLHHRRYDGLIVAGLAGGLNPELRLGDAVIYDLCHDARGLKEKTSGCDENASIRCEDQLSELLFRSLQSAGRRSFCGSGLTVNRIITEARDKILLGEHYRAAAADMESYEVLSVCEGSGLPAAVLRVISDDTRSNLPDFNRAAEVAGRMNLWRMAAAMARRPAASLKFLLGLRPALNALRENLKIILHA